jgi:hypothetical protein
VDVPPRPLNNFTVLNDNHFPELGCVGVKARLARGGNQDCQLVIYLFYKVFIVFVPFVRCMDLYVLDILLIQVIMPVRRTSDFGRETSGGVIRLL